MSHYTKAAERKIDGRARGYVLRIEIVAQELEEAWSSLSKEERLERLEFIRESAELAYEQTGGVPYWLLQGPTR